MKAFYTFVRNCFNFKFFKPNVKILFVFLIFVDIHLARAEFLDDVKNFFAARTCNASSDCEYGYSCRSKNGGGNECRKSTTLLSEKIEDGFTCSVSADCLPGSTCRSKKGGGNECRMSAPEKIADGLVCRVSDDCLFNSFCINEQGGGKVCRRIPFSDNKESLTKNDHPKSQQSNTGELKSNNLNDQAKQASRISITASATQPDASGVVTINIKTNTDTSSLKINGEELGGKADGSYSVKRVARVGQETNFILAATDVYGNTDTKSITVTRQAVDSKVVFGQLNAANVKQQPARDAVAIIIGIEKYKRVAKADFANADAQDFYDYASRALGIKPENIKLLIDDGADDAEIYRAFQNWLPLKVKKGKTEVFVFFSGHGLPSQDGKSLYLLPWGVDKDFVEKTAINQKEIIASLQAVQPKSVTMFLDSCYSGQARGGETLLASARPIALKAEANAYPPNFTVISASAPDQLSSSSPDLKHGIFSYYLMKGMEGDADQNKDGKITVAEIQEYLTDMVGRQAMGMNRKQQPQLFGDADRVLVGR